MSKRISRREFLCGTAAGVTAFALSAMTGVGLTASAEEESYDFGGQVVKVYGGEWSNLNPDSDSNSAYLDYAKQIEEKYNIVLEYTYPEGYDGYNLSDIVMSSLTSGEGCVDIMTSEIDAFMNLVSGDCIVDITDSYDQLEVGSLYTDAVKWNGHVYGVTFDDIGNTYVLVYSRDYLEEIGMDVTPTEKFLAGEWDYDSCIEYLTELKAKLPDGVYPISVQYFHWACMSGSANGVEMVNSDGKIGIADEAFAESMEFYTELMDLGLAAPVEVSTDDDGNTTVTMPYGTSELNSSYVMTMAQYWQLSGLQESIGDFGIVYWPWGSNVTCDGDYTTLSDNYKVSHVYWGQTVVVKDAPERTGIDADILFKIAQDYYALCSPASATSMHAAWEAEQAGEEPVIGMEAGTVRCFCTVEDYELYDWGHTRVTLEWGKAFADSGVADLRGYAQKVIGEGYDARSTGDSYYSSSLANMQDLGLVE